MTTEQLLAESVDDARTRELAVAGTLFARTKTRVVLSGAGNLGRKVLAALRAGLLEPLAFTDTESGLMGRTVEGLLVMSPQEAAIRWGSSALFVVTSFRPLLGEGLGDRLKELNRLGCVWTTSFLEIAWRFPGVLPHFGAELPSRTLGHARELHEVNNLLNDEVSREVFRQQLEWRLRGGFPSDTLPYPDQYFPRDIILPRLDERIVDGGAFDGDTLRAMPMGFARSWAIEPDPLTVARLRLRCDARTTIWETALGMKSGLTRFNALGSTASSRSEDGSVEVAVSRLDDLLSEESPTYIKLDVEGDELAAIEGGREVIFRAQPVVAACIYHRPDHLWEIPLLLHRLLPKHRHFMRIHEYDGFELVAYAVPIERCRRQL